MVGVYYWALCVILTSVVANSKPKDCPAVCDCLGSYVDCSSKNLDTIPSAFPSWATHLNLHNNAIKKLNGIAFRNLTDLTELKLNKNNIHEIPKDFFSQKGLKILDLNRNRLKRIDALVFKPLSQLKTLKLKRNQINELSDGAFYGLESLEKLILDNNFIKIIKKGWLYGLDTLKELSLSRNNVNRIDKDSWEFLKKLTLLDLSHNQIESIEVNTFENLGELQKLTLNNNDIKVIKENAFVHLPKLKTLILSDNKISWAVEDATGVFKGLNDLNKFCLAGNNIKSINRNAFIGLKNVTSLNLGYNNITSMQRNPFSELPLLKELIINTTSLICDCNMKWFIDWMTGKSFNIEMVCAFPDGLRGKSLTQVPAASLTCDELPKPRFLESPEAHIMALKGENVTLKCKAVSSSNSSMTFQWKKDNIELSRADLYSNTTIVDSNIVSYSELLLPWVNHSSAGKYQCIVSNDFGTTYSQKSIISVLVYPTFVKVPRNVTVKAGETAKLECAAMGEPQPEIGWTKDGGNDFPAARERRMLVMPNDVVFFITDVKESDMGVYSCTAHNAAGTAVANATLTIEEKPSFVKPMEDKEVTEGELVVLQCTVKGTPKPSITWRKDGEAITATERHFFTAGDQLMVIVDTVQSDSGLYECFLNNSLGEERGLSRLKVKPGLIDRSNMMGIIIITVVCCAVFTSVIWVVIIYKTRRRTPSCPEVQELPELIDRSLTHAQPLAHFLDNISDHSSSKDSGTGDSAKRSSDDLAQEDFGICAHGAAEGGAAQAPLLVMAPSNHDRAASAQHIKDA